MRIALWAAIMAVFLLPAKAQHNHDAGHNDYQGWASGVVADCCNNRDCGSVRDEDIRQTATGPEILIDGEWCPVQRQHYTTKGKSPNWSTAHACIRVKSPYSAEGCIRLLCYMPAGGF